MPSAITGTPYYDYSYHAPVITPAHQVLQTLHQHGQPIPTSVLEAVLEEDVRRGQQSLDPHIVNAYNALTRPPPAPPEPSALDKAIADPDVSIYEVIRLAEESFKP